MKGRDGWGNCVPRCEEDDGCRPGYVCLGLGDGGYCESDWAAIDKLEPGSGPPRGARGGARADDPTPAPAPREGSVVVFDPVCDSRLIEETPGVEEDPDLRAFDFELPPGTVSYMVMPVVAEGSVHLQSIEGPGGVFDLWEDGRLPFADSWAPGEPASILMPYLPELAHMAAPGRYTMQVMAQAEVCHFLVVRTAPGSRLDLNLIFVGAAGLDAQSGRTDDRLGYALDRAEAIFRDIGVTFGTIRYLDADAETIAAHRVLDEYAGFDALKRTSSAPGPTDEERLSVNVFLVDRFTVDGDSKVLGKAADIPAPPGVHGTAGSGMAVALEDLHEPGLIGSVLAHELGHMLGLKHTTDDGYFIDPISDTPECIEEWAETRDDCPDRPNLMFPEAAFESIDLSPGQAYVIRSNPVLY